MQSLSQKNIGVVLVTSNRIMVDYIIVKIIYYLENVFSIIFVIDNIDNIGRITLFLGNLRYHLMGNFICEEYCGRGSVYERITDLNIKTNSI